jgi:hypothetical protein
MLKRVPYHSIIGDRGRGDTPNSSDGVVPYWSSHLDGAQSEKIVPSGHGAEHSPEAITEVLRILREQVASRRSGKQPRPRCAEPQPGTIRQRTAATAVLATEN